MKTLVRMPTAPVDVPEEEEEIQLRREDVSQEGRLRVEALPVALGALLWDRILPKGPIGPQLRADGIQPFLTRLVGLGGEGPVAVAPARVCVRWRLARVEDDDGEVERIVALAWFEVHGSRARGPGPHPEGGGESTRAGRWFAEYTLTRPRAPPAQRVVRGLRVPGVSTAALGRYAVDAPGALAALPRGATVLDPHAVPDPADGVFGVDDTDGDRRVNVAAVVRTLRAAALRRLLQVGHPGPHALGELEIAFRRPIFAGGAARIALRAFGVGARVGVSADLGPLDPGARRVCHARLVFDPAEVGRRLASAVPTSR